VVGTTQHEGDVDLISMQSLPMGIAINCYILLWIFRQADQVDLQKVRGSFLGDFPF
jgi:hypothetical protein